MIRTVMQGSRYGAVDIPSSKSQAHRILIAAALSENAGKVICRGISDDLSATMECLTGFGARFLVKGNEILTEPMDGSQEQYGHGLHKVREMNLSERSILPCGESGSTLRFMLPLAGALGKPAEMIMKGRLPYRPMEVYEDILQSHGMNICREGDRLYCEGKLQPGIYTLPGNISSQYFTGLLMSLPLLDGDSLLRWEGTLESADYVAMTEEVLEHFGILFEKLQDGYRIVGRQHYRIESPDTAPAVIRKDRTEEGSEEANGKMPVSDRVLPQIPVEGDYSSAAFFLCMGAFSETGITAFHLSPASRQGDRRILKILKEFGAEVAWKTQMSSGDRQMQTGQEPGAGFLKEQCEAVCVKKGTLQGIEIDASMIPDLIPVLSVVAAAAKGTTRIVRAQRLRMKESDRIRSTCEMLKKLGAHVQELEDGLVIEGTGSLAGGKEVDSCRDHRIAMAAAVGASICRNPVTIAGAECVSKSYPDFWNDFHAMGLEGAC